LQAAYTAWGMKEKAAETNEKISALR